MNRLIPLIEYAQQKLADLLAKVIASGPSTREQYVRYLSMQYHLNKDVQRYFMTAAAHRDLARRRALRKFLVEFANEEELHYVVAGNDLRKFGAEVMPTPFDVTLWHAYFERMVVERPFVRLGAACILENISAGVASPLIKQALASPFLSRENTKYLVIHQHETQPHGEQILDALGKANLDESQLADLVEGARKGTVMYLRMAEWALDEQALSHHANNGHFELRADDAALVVNFEMSHLNDSAVH